MQVVFLALVGLQGLGIFSSPSFAARQEELELISSRTQEPQQLFSGEKKPLNSSEDSSRC